MQAGFTHSLRNEPTRRDAIRLLVLLGVIGAAGTARADVAGWPAQAFKIRGADETVKQLYGKPFELSDKVTLETPEIAENGAVVPISVSTTLPGVTGISLLVPGNPSTLAASYVLADGTLPAIGCRLKMAATSDVVAIVEAGGKLYAARKQVKVTLGGCGG
jgi:sulfur-oxidizing protein SoxY